jgi:hypothetical protein
VLCGTGFPCAMRQPKNASGKGLFYGIGVDIASILF